MSLRPGKTRKRWTIAVKRSVVVLWKVSSTLYSSGLAEMT